MDHNKEGMIKEQLQDLISAADFKAADRILQEYLAQGGLYDDVLAIYDGYIGQSMGDGERTWAAIRQGLCFNPENYELYVMLGNYYLDENREQSWLCYEHALACCQEQEDQAQIQKMLEQLEECGAAAGRVSVVLRCHGKDGSVRPCVESIRRALAGCSGQIVAVVDRHGETALGVESDREWLRQQADLVLVELGQELPGSRTVDGGKADSAGKGETGTLQVWEKGTAAAWTDADCLLTDSSVILSGHALFWLRMALYGSAGAGTVGSMSGCVMNSRLSGLVKAVADPVGLEQLVRRINVPMRYPCEIMPGMKGAAVLVRRQVLSQVGAPGADFADGMLLDQEYGRKVEAAGFRNLLCENSFLLYQGGGRITDHTEGTKGMPGMNFQTRSRTPGAGKRRFLLFYAGNEKGYYQDTRYFTSEISGELVRRGHETFICDLARGSHDGAALEAYLAKGVDAVLTFNGEAIQKEDMWQLWNQLGALVVNILMDPPFHMDLCPYLESPAMEQYLLLCPDENHVEYVKRYFPQVKHVEFMPHGGTPVEKEPVPWNEKHLDLLFSGTYTRPEGFLEVMKQTMKPEDFKIYAGMGERILQDTRLSVDQVVAETLFPDNRPLVPGRIQGAVAGMSLLDGWVRMVMRERVVVALVKGGVDLYVLGDGWQNCPCADSPRLHTLSKERIPLADTLARMENARINLNVMPWFKAGSHDRIFNAMLRGSIALTDPSSYLRKHFQDRESIVYYSLEELEKLPEIVHNLLNHPDQAEAIARRGYGKAAAFTWENYVEELLAKVEGCLV